MTTADVRVRTVRTGVGPVGVLAAAPALQTPVAPTQAHIGEGAEAGNDRTPVAVYCFIKNLIGASDTGAVAIDNKIEQAMDLVKSHLMFAVREEVEVLRDKIATLMDRIDQLEVENAVLKAHATKDTLEQLGRVEARAAAGGQRPEAGGERGGATAPR